MSLCGELSSVSSLPEVSLKPVYSLKLHPADILFPKDSVFRHYISSERFYESPVEEERLNCESIRMGAFLLGSDIATMSEHSSLEGLLSLDKERLMDVLVRHYDVGDAGIEQIINDFWDGMVSDR